MACSPSVRKPAALTVSASSLILDCWRARSLALRTFATGSSWFSGWFMQMVALSVLRQQLLPRAALAFLGALRVLGTFEPTSTEASSAQLWWYGCAAI